MKINEEIIEYCKNKIEFLREQVEIASKLGLGTSHKTSMIMCYKDIIKFIKGENEQNT